MISDEQVENAVDYIRDKAVDYGQAKAERIYLEEFLGSKRAILLRQVEGTVQERESYARAHPEYLQLLDGLKVAVSKEETIRWLMVAAQAKVEVWRTQCANNRV